MEQVRQLIKLQSWNLISYSPSTTTTIDNNKRWRHWHTSLSLNNIYNHCTSDSPAGSSVSGGDAALRTHVSSVSSSGGLVFHQSVTYLHGDDAQLLCDTAGGELYTVLWYKQKQGQPFYTWVLDILKNMIWHTRLTLRCGTEYIYWMESQFWKCILRRWKASTKSNCFILFTKILKYLHHLKSHQSFASDFKWW